MPSPREDSSSPPSAPSTFSSFGSKFAGNASSNPRPEGADVRGRAAHAAVFLAKQEREREREGATGGIDGNGVGGGVGDPE